MEPATEYIREPRQLSALFIKIGVGISTRLSSEELAFARGSSRPTPFTPLPPRIASKGIPRTLCFQGGANFLSWFVLWFSVPLSVVIEVSTALLPLFYELHLICLAAFLT